jgi:hypothetical protein
MAHEADNVMGISLLDQDLKICFPSFKKLVRLYLLYMHVSSVWIISSGHACTSSGHACTSSGHACTSSGHACTSSGHACTSSGHACTSSGHACTVRTSKSPRTRAVCNPNAIHHTAMYLLRISVLQLCTNRSFRISFVLGNTLTTIFDVMAETILSSTIPITIDNEGTIVAILFSLSYAD